MKLKSSVKNRSRKFWIWIAVLLVIAAGIIYVVLTLNAPSEGTVNNNIKTEEKSVPNTSVRVDGKTVSFSHPSRFNSVPPEKAATIEVEKFAFLNAQTISQNLSIVVKKLPSGVLTDDSGYNYRKVYSSKFNFETKQVGNNTYTIVTDPSEAFNKVAYTTYNGLLAIITMTSGDAVNSAEIQAAYDKVLGSLEWQ